MLWRIDFIALIAALKPRRNAVIIVAILLIAKDDRWDCARALFD